MRLSSTDRREQIIDIAMELFAKHGFEGTTTREIAGRAGINEALVFRHFPCKDDLFEAVLEEKCSVRERRELLLGRLASADDDLNADISIFADVAEAYLRRNAEDPSASRLFVYSALRSHKLTRRFYQTHFGEFYEAIAAHITRRQAAGQYRDIDPQIAARGFAGMVVYHHLVQDMFGGKRFQKFDPRHVALTLADLWVRGMTAAPKTASSRNGNGRPARKTKK